MKLCKDWTGEPQCKVELASLKSFREAVNFGVDAGLEPESLKGYGIDMQRLNRAIRIREAQLSLFFELQIPLEEEHES